MYRRQRRPPLFPQAGERDVLLGPGVLELLSLPGQASVRLPPEGRQGGWPGGEVILMTLMTMMTLLTLMTLITLLTHMTLKTLMTLI